MCCGPATLLWFALSVFRVADKTGIDGHVSFLPQKKKKNKKGMAPCFPGWKKAYMSIDANHISTPRDQMKQTTEECRVRSTSYDKGSRFAMA